MRLSILTKFDRPLFLLLEKTKVCISRSATCLDQYINLGLQEGRDNSELGQREHKTSGIVSEVSFTQCTIYQIAACCSHNKTFVQI